MTRIVFPLALLAVFTGFTILAASSTIPAVSTPAFAADEQRVGLDAQTGVAVTIYNEDLALVKDRRSVTLAKGGNRVAFVDVSGVLRPETALLKNKRGGIDILEQNFDFDLLTPEKLLEKSVGGIVRLIRTHPETGVDTIEQAKVLSVAGGTVLQVGDRIETNPPGRIVFAEVPPNLRARPTLVLELESAAAGTEAVELSYLTGGLGWKADYVAELGADEKTLDLNAWVTLTNTSGTTYRDAKLQLVAGDVNRVRDMVGRRERSLAMMADSEMAAPKMREESLFEYHLYTLERPTTVAENQTKQVALLSGSKIPVRKQYRLENASNRYEYWPQEIPRVNPTVSIAFDNKESDRLGLPLPKGIVRVYKADSEGQALFVGEDSIEHTPKNETVELALGKAFDVTARSEQVDYDQIAKNVIEVAFELELKNAKREPVTVIVAEQLPAEWKVIEESHEHKEANAFLAEWEVPVAAESTTKLTYRIRITYGR
jgi:hypothetical protein